jgi:hypothetical protein
VSTASSLPKSTLLAFPFSDRGLRREPMLPPPSARLWLHRSTFHRSIKRWFRTTKSPSR